jgi:aspartate racemase
MQSFNLAISKTSMHMKTIGLIGGMSWESSVLYYQLINRQINAALGSAHSGKSILYTVDFEELVQHQKAGNWDTLAQLMVKAALTLQHAGADMVLICANTMHKVADEVQQHLQIPLVHIADVVSDAIKATGIKKVGLLGTKYTMEHDFLKNRFLSHGIETLIPEVVDRDMVHAVIYNELAKGIIHPASREAYLEVMEKLAAGGAEGIILGCTEIGLLIQQENTPIPVFDTTTIHAGAAVKLALS